MKYLILLAVSFILTSCASGPNVKPEPDKALLVEHISILKPLLLTFKVRFLSVDGKDLKSNDKYPSYVYLDPGDHDVVVSCYSDSIRNPVPATGVQNFKRNYKINHTYKFTMKEVGLGKCITDIEEVNNYN